jgi:hypothetical protein
MCTLKISTASSSVRIFSNFYACCNISFDRMPDADSCERISIDNYREVIEAQGIRVRRFCACCMPAPMHVEAYNTAQEIQVTAPPTAGIVYHGEEDLSLKMQLQLAKHKLQRVELRFEFTTSSTCLLDVSCVYQSAVARGQKGPCGCARVGRGFASILAGDRDCSMLCMDRDRRAAGETYSPMCTRSAPTARETEQRLLQWWC